MIDPRIVLTFAHNLYYRKSIEEITDIQFTPTIKGKAGRCLKVKKAYYPEEYKILRDSEASEYDFAVLELENELNEEYGYLGIDFKDIGGIEEI